MCIRDRLWCIHCSQLIDTIYFVVPLGYVWYLYVPSMVPVSYTHLDVYKRQAVNNEYTTVEDYAAHFSF